LVRVGDALSENETNPVGFETGFGLLITTFSKNAFVSD